MTKPELADWLQMTKDLISLNQESVIVGIPGYLNYRRYSAQYSFGNEFPVLQMQEIYEDGKETNSYYKCVPFPIKEGDKILGYMILVVSSIPTIGFTNVTIENGTQKVYWFDLWKKANK